MYGNGKNTRKRYFTATWYKSFSWINFAALLWRSITFIVELLQMHIAQLWAAELMLPSPRSVFLTRKMQWANFESMNVLRPIKMHLQLMQHQEVFQLVHSFRESMIRNRANVERVYFIKLLAFATFFDDDLPYAMTTLLLDTYFSNIALFCLSSLRTSQLVTWHL